MGKATKIKANNPIADIVNEITGEDFPMNILSPVATLLLLLLLLWLRLLLLSFWWWLLCLFVCLFVSIQSIKFQLELRGCFSVVGRFF